MRRRHRLPFAALLVVLGVLVLPGGSIEAQRARARAPLASVSGPAASVRPSPAYAAAPRLDAAPRPICYVGNPLCPPPDVMITPGGGTFSTASQSVTIDWCGHAPIFPGTRQIVLNGVDVTSSFSYTTSTKSGCSSHASSTGTITLPSGTSSLTAYIEDNIGQSGSASAWYTLSAPPTGAIVSLAAHNGTNRDVGLCVASCFDQVLTYSTPSYRSLDQDRALTLVYRSSQATPAGTVTLDVRDTAAGKTATQISLTLIDSASGAIVMAERAFANQQGATLRIAGQFDASGKTTGSYPYVAAVKSYYTDGTTRTTPRYVRVLIINERSSPYGAGWSVAGLQRTYPDAAGTGMTVVDGTGSAQYFTGPCTAIGCSFTSPTGDFSVLMRQFSPYGTSLRRQYPDGTIVGYGNDGTQAWVDDRFGNHTSYAYSGGRLSSVTDPVGQVTSISPSSGSYSITVPGGRVSTISLEGLGRVTGIQDPLGGHPFTWQAVDATAYRYTQWTDRRGGQWNATYDCSGHLATLTAPTIVANGVSTRPVTRGAHVDLQTTACALSAPATAVLATNAVAWTRNARNVPTTYTVDASLAPTRVVDSLGRITTITRDTASRVTKVVTPSGHVVAATWTGPNITQEVDSTTGRTINYTFDSRYNLPVDVSGHTTAVHNVLNASGTLIVSTSIAGAAATTFYYDARGRDTLVIDPEGHRTRTQYGASAFNNLAYVEVPGGRRTRYEYDAYGLSYRVFDPSGNVSSVLHDSLGRPRTTTDPLGYVTAFTYDELYLTTVTDAKGQVYQYNRNAVGWVESSSDPGQRMQYFGYDASGNLKSHTNRRGQTITFQYDALDRQIQLNTDPQRSTTFTYDPADRWATVANAASTDTIRFDVTGRVVMEIAQRLGRRLEDTSVYNDTMGVRAMSAWGPFSPHFVRYEYDNARKLTSLLTGVGYTNVGGYNADRQATTVGFPTGAVQNTWWSSNHDRGQVSYSPAGSGADIAFQHTIHTDSLGRTAERYRYGLVDNADTSRVYSYDAAGQLVGYRDRVLGFPSCHMDMDEGRVCSYASEQTVRQENYTYDQVGNRTDGVNTIDAGNRVRDFHGFALSYDADGNLVRKIKSGVADDSLEWNALGELTRVLRGGVQVAQFAYDGFGRRVSKVTANGTVNYQYDGANVVAEFDAAWAYLADYGFYPGVDVPHSVTIPGNYTYYFATEGESNVIGLLSASGSGAAAQYRYDPFGLPERNDQGVTNSLRFQARPYDNETGLYYFRARYYDPSLARFISEDPVGLASGINPYAFEGNDPVNGSDPSGLDPECRVSDDNPCPIDGITITEEADDRTNGWARHPSDRGGPTPKGPFGPAQPGVGPTPPAGPGLCSVQTGEGQFSLNGSAVGGIGLPGGFYGVGGAVGVTSGGRIFLQLSGSMSLGAGVYAGVGLGIAAGRGSVTPTGFSSSSGTIAQINAGLGESGGVSVSREDGGRWGGSSTILPKAGVGWGLMGAVGRYASGVVATGSIPALRKLLLNFCK
jgi:RHS repeat-associated protein